MSNKNQKKMVKIIAIVLAVLMAGSAVVAVILSFGGHYGHAHAEAAAVQADNQYAFTIEYLEDEQALQISQRLVYTNTSDSDLDRVLFYAPANLLRRESAMLYLYEDYEAAFPEGYVPGGIDLTGVQVNGENADYGFQGEDESYLRVACELAPGEACEFLFDYYLLLSENNSFLGIGDTDCRLSDFYFAAAAYDSYNHDFVLNTPLSFTGYQNVIAADYSAAVALPEDHLLAGSGSIQLVSESKGMKLWSVSCENARGFSLSFGKNWKERTLTSASGIELRCLAKRKGTAEDVLRAAEDALACLEAWFGPCPAPQIHFVESDYDFGFKNSNACIWLSSEVLKSKDDLQHAAYFSLAQQYFGLTAYAAPASDAWLSDSISEYISYMILEEIEGREAYLEKLNEEVVPALQLTIPGGLYTTSDASLMTESEYSILILDRGAAIFHELCGAMGRETFIEALRIFYEKGLMTPVLGEYDLVDALDAASGLSWEGFLTDWLFNIDEMAAQSYIYLE